MVSIAEQFDNYLNELHGKNEAELARKEKTWVDSNRANEQEYDSSGSESRERERHRKRKRRESLGGSDSAGELEESDNGHRKKAYRRKKR